jgi:hypothetical protein
MKKPIIDTKQFIKFYHAASAALWLGLFIASVIKSASIWMLFIFLILFIVNVWLYEFYSQKD